MPDAGGLSQQLWIIAGVIALAAFAIGIGQWLQRRRTAAFEAAVLPLGLRFRARDPELPAQPFFSLPLFQRGHGGWARNVGRGDRSWLFDYGYRTGHGKNQSRRVQTVAAVHAQHGVTFELGAEGWLDKLGSALGGRDVDFDADPAFSRSYRLRGPDEATLRERFGPGLRQQLVRQPGWSLEGDGDWVIAYRARRRVAPEDLAQFFIDARDLASRLGRR